MPSGWQGEPSACARSQCGDRCPLTIAMGDPDTAPGGRMGKDLAVGSFSREDRARYRHKVQRCLDALALMLDEVAFDTENRLTGLEIEINLMDGDGEPAMRNAEILTDLADPTFKTELGQFN